MQKNELVESINIVTENCYKKLREESANLYDLEMKIEKLIREIAWKEPDIALAVKGSMKLHIKKEKSNLSLR